MLVLNTRFFLSYLVDFHLIYLARGISLHFYILNFELWMHHILFILSSRWISLKNYNCSISFLFSRIHIAMHYSIKKIKCTTGTHTHNNNKRKEGEFLIVYSVYTYKRNPYLYHTYPFYSRLILKWLFAKSVELLYPECGDVVWSL